MEQQTLQKMANAIRGLSIDGVEAAKSGHPGMPLGMSDVATVLFSEFLKFYPHDPYWYDRDRFVLSAGHGSMLLYSLLHLTGYEDMSLDDLKAFRALGSKTAGHPEYGHAEGIETTTGPLGQGFANAVGMAIAEKILCSRHGEDLINHHTYALVGDGCLMEGISHEAASLAGHLGLSKLIVLFDDNDITIDGPANLSYSDDTKKRFEAYGFDVQTIDGHSADEIREALKKAQKSDKPSFIACKTTIGFGAPTKAGTSKVHGSPLGGDEAAATKKALGLSETPFDIDEGALKAWREAGARYENAYEASMNKLDNLDEPLKSMLSETFKPDIGPLFEKLKEKAYETPRNLATRQTSGFVLEVLNKTFGDLFIGGSADLTGSNNTKSDANTDICKDNFTGNYINYGVREHAMAAVMNGLALHGPFVPYGGTFLAFADYLRPSLRLSALMGQQVFYIMTHDSIGLGEDGPTHQPIEHLASLRAMPHVNVYRPADLVETLDCYQLALQDKHRPAVFALTRQSLPQVRTKPLTHEEDALKGAYILKDAEKPDGILIATGSEVHIALETAEKLEGEGLNFRVVSMPCREVFMKQKIKYRQSVLPPEVHTFVIEAASGFGWETFVTSPDHMFVMKSFGVSAPLKDVYNHFGFTAGHIAPHIVKVLKGEKVA